ncbi:alpha/beta hydrolase family protein, partial [Candidatus Latescibacterota bacterium]
MYQLFKVRLRPAGFHIFVLFLVFSFFTTFPAESENVKDLRLKNLRDPDLYELRLKPVQSLEQWQERKKQLRETLLLRTGLWPEPGRTPLNAKIFDERKGDGFTVAKVYFESLPGFLATGNLYRPTSGTGPYPAIISPHGHWEYGRLQNSTAGSIPGRCIDFARQGFVVFSIDMVGYNDSFQLPHDPYKSRAQLKADEPVPYESRLFRGDFDYPEANLYGFNLGGLHLWNNIRCVDFLTSLPYVDSQRIGATGASGGATQTLFLMIADERIKVAAPVNIIGAEKHPGCQCENMPGIWIDTSTIELCAAFAPRPLLLMSATKDPWTHSTPEREYPLIKRYYSLYNAEDMIENVHIDAGHNYNAETRTTVYEWFCRHLKSPLPPIKKPSQVAEEVKKLGDLRVFPDKILPESALTGREVIQNWKNESEKMFAQALPLNSEQLDEFAVKYRGMLKRILVLNDSFQGKVRLQ